MGALVSTNPSFSNGWMHLENAMLSYQNEVTISSSRFTKVCILKRDDPIAYKVVKMNIFIYLWRSFCELISPGKRDVTIVSAKELSTVNSAGINCSKTVVVPFSVKIGQDLLSNCKEADLERLRTSSFSVEVRDEKKNAQYFKVAFRDLFQFGNFYSSHRLQGKNATLLLTLSNFQSSEFKEESSVELTIPKRERAEVCLVLKSVQPLQVEIERDKE